MRRLTTILALGLLSSCSHQAINDDPVEAPAYQVAGSWEEVEDALTSLSPGFKATLGDSFFSDYELLKEDPLFRIKLARTAGHFPVFLGYPITLHLVSPYDKHPLEFTIRAPLSDRKPTLTLLLGAKEEFEALLNDRNSTGWLLHIPSREGLNYQLTAEGDFWHVLDSVTKLYPGLTKTPTYIAGSGQSADAALLLANNYRYRFSGVAFSGGSIGLRLSNLDHLPVASFGSVQGSTPWAGHHLVGTLQSRGNRQALSQLKELKEALAFLHQHTPPPLAPYRFSDESYAQVWPSLRVLSRKSQSEPVIVTARRTQQVLSISAPNVASVEIDRTKLPKEITQVRLNDDLYLLPAKQTKLRLGEESLPSNWPRKGDTPGNLLSFFRTDPVLVVYQDGTDSLFSERAHAAAKRISHLQFAGLPTQTEVALPVMPLSTYLEKSHSPHRAILIVTTEQANNFLQKSDSYLPFQSTGSTLSLIYPPEDHPSCKLAWVLAAPDAEKLQKLTKENLTLTNLYSTYDLKIYPDKGPSIARVFDSYWGVSYEEAEALAIPPQDRATWETYIKDLILAKTATAAMILGRISAPQTHTPTNLSHTQLNNFLPERRFAYVTLAASASATIGNKLLDATDEAAYMGLDKYLTGGRFDPKKMRKKRKKILIEVSALSALSEKELATIDYEIFPYSLHEILDEKIKADPHRFGRELIRLNQTLNGSIY